jgi:hypothetical protein
VPDEKELDSKMSKSRINSRMIASASVVSWLLVLWVFNASRYLRPVADDYCIGVRGELGPIGGFLRDFQSYSGFATPSFLTNLLVGVPLAYGDLWIASSLTFVAASLGISLLALSAFAATGGFPRNVRLTLIYMALLVPIPIVAWWTFLWFPLESLTESPMDNLAIGLTHWQNLNSAYVLPTALILSAGLLLLRPSIFRNWLVTLASAFLGLITGLMGPTFGMAAVLFILLLVGWGAFQSEKMKRRYLIDIGVTLLTVLLGLLIAYLSPGTQARASYYDAGEVTFSPNSIVGWVMAILPENILMFGELLLHWGTLVVFMLFLGLGFFAGKRISALRTATFLPISIGLTVFGISLTSATIVTDTFAYGAYWHSSSIAVVAFAACASFGFWAGGVLVSQERNSVNLVASFALLVGLVSGVGSSLDLSTSIVEREKVWANGPASITGIIEDREVEWIRECADQLSQVNRVFSE